RVLRDCEGNITRAAKSLGIHRQALQRKLRSR
ncbi:MAG: helix-turn-helix domain-containing protein, partial [Deltaproteobacteria bacterium]|nr:helix-turn-helix domain-containing protein [Deltaproteobacteria bacterium]